MRSLGIKIEDMLRGIKTFDIEIFHYTVRQNMRVGWFRTREYVNHFKREE